MNGQSPYGLRYVILTFYRVHIFQLSAAYFSVHAIEKCCQLFLLIEKSSLLSTKWVKLTPEISHFFGPGTWTRVPSSLKRSVKKGGMVHKNVKTPHYNCTIGNYY